MTVSNHAITAANLTLIVKSWWVLPIVLASHFIVDLLPHYGQMLGKRNRLFILIQIIDALVLISVFVLVLSSPGVNFALMLVAMAVACSPDLIWVYRFIRESLGEKDIPKSWISKLHSKMNWMEF